MALNIPDLPNVLIIDIIKQAYRQMDLEENKIKFVKTINLINAARNGVLDIQGDCRFSHRRACVDVDWLEENDFNEYQWGLWCDFELERDIFTVGRLETRMHPHNGRGSRLAIGS